MGGSCPLDLVLPIGRMRGSERHGEGAFIYRKVRTSAAAQTDRRKTTPSTRLSNQRWFEREFFGPTRAVPKYGREARLVFQPPRPEAEGRGTLDDNLRRTKSLVTISKPWVVSRLTSSESRGNPGCVHLGIHIRLGRAHRLRSFVCTGGKPFVENRALAGR